MSNSSCVIEKSEEKLLITPKASPSSSPRPSPVPENRKDHSILDFKDPYASIIEESLLGFDRRSSNTDLNQTDLAKSESSSTTSSKEKKTKKKSSWFNSFYPTYKSRSQDFKRIFKDVPDEERLVVDYSCAVQKEILVHGRLYVTQNYICFYANIFGWETNIVLRWKDVAAITKEKTAIVIPNAVLICTKTEKFFFTSFVARDKVYLMLFRLWQNALMDRQMSNQEMWQWVHKSYGAELGLTSDDEDYIAPGAEDDKAVYIASSDSLPEGEILIMDEIYGKEKLLEEKESVCDDPNFTNSKKAFAEAQFNTDIESDVSDLDYLPLCEIQTAKCNCSHEGHQLVNEILPINVDQLFTLLFTSSKFFLDFHASRKTTDLVQTPWKRNSTDNTKTRVVNLTMALTQAIGPKTSQVTDTQIIASCSRPGSLYSVISESISGGVPYSDSFFIETHFCMKKIAEKQSSLEVFAQIKFKKSVWGLVKGMIEKNCLSGLEDYFLALRKALNTEVEKCIPDMKRRTKRKIKQVALPRSESVMNKLGVSAIPTVRALSVLTSQKVTSFILIVLILLLSLNFLLYRKLWILEEEQPPFNILYSQMIKNPPATHDEWLKLFQKQDKLYNQEMKKWHDMLKAAINTLKQTESILLTLQNSTNSNVMNKVKVEDLMENGSKWEKAPRQDL